MNRIKEALEEKGIKQKWLADKLNKSYNMVNSYVQRTVSNHDLKYFIQFPKYLMWKLKTF